MKEIEARYYNEELKKRFVKEKEKMLSISSNYIDVQFRKTSSMEYELNKDISNWTVYEIIEYYKIINYSSLESLMCLNSTLSQYTQFCLENSLVKDNQNHFLECSIDVLVTCLNKAILDKKIVNRETVLDWVNQLPNPRDQFILLGLFEFGKSKDFTDLVHAKKEHLNGNLFLLSDRTVTISDKLVNIIHDCIDETVYYSISGGNKKQVNLVDYGYIIKSYPNQSISTNDYQKGRNIYITAKRIFQYLDVGDWMTPNALSESGKIYFINERAKQLGMTSEDYIKSKYINECEAQFGASITKHTFLKKYKKYLI